MSCLRPPRSNELILESHYYELRKQGVQELRAGRFSEAKNHLVDSGQGLALELGIDDQQRLENKVLLAKANIRRGQYRAAELLLREADTKLTDAYGESFSATQMALVVQVKLFLATGEKDKARDTYERLVKVWEECDGDSDPYLSDAPAHLADELEACNERQKALIVRRRRFEALAKAHEPYHHDVLASMSDLARVTDAIGDLNHFHLAEQLYKKAIVIASSNLGKEHQDSLAILANYAASILLVRSLAYRHRVWYALELVAYVTRGKQKRLGNDDPATLNAVKDLGVLLDFHGQYESAAKIFQYVVDYSIAKLGRWHENTITVMEKLAMTMNSWGKFEDAQVIAAEVFQIRMEQFGEHAQVSDSLFVRRIKIWYEICFKHTLAADTGMSKTDSQVGHNVARDAQKLSIAAGTDLMHASVWKLKAHLSMRNEELNFCTIAEFYGWEKQPETPLPKFRERFRVSPTYYENVDDGVYLVRHEESLNPAQLVLERILVPKEDFIVALALGGDLSEYDYSSDDGDEDVKGHIDAQKSASQLGNTQGFGTVMETLNIKARFPPYQPLAGDALYDSQIQTDSLSKVLET